MQKKGSMLVYSTLQSDPAIPDSVVAETTRYRVLSFNKGDLHPKRLRYADGIMVPPHLTRVAQLLTFGPLLYPDRKA